MEKRLDPEGKHKWSQNKNVIDPKYTCFPTALITALEVVTDNDNYFDYLETYSEYDRVIDKLTYFMRNEPSCLELYKLYKPNEFKAWDEDKTKTKTKYSDKSYPPNEIWKVAIACFNLFLSLNKGDDFTPHAKISNLNFEEMKAEIDKGNSLVVSVKTPTIMGHMITVIGYSDKEFIVYDSYGLKDFQNYPAKNNATYIPFEDFKKYCKPVNSTTKMVAIINP